MLSKALAKIAKSANRRIDREDKFVGGLPEIPSVPSFITVREGKDEYHLSTKGMTPILNAYRQYEFYDKVTRYYPPRFKHYYVIESTA
jgi:hypothetical protein